MLCAKVKLPGAGAKSAAKVKEMLEDGFLSRNIAFSQNPEAQAEAAFCAVWGVGPAHAQEWVRRGLRTLEDLRGSPDCLAMMSVRERAGLRHAEDFAQRIPRAVWTPARLLLQISNARMRPRLDVAQAPEGVSPAVSMHGHHAYATDARQATSLTEQLQPSCRGRYQTPHMNARLPPPALSGYDGAAPPQ